MQNLTKRISEKSEEERYNKIRENSISEGRHVSTIL